MDRGHPHPATSPARIGDGGAAPRFGTKAWDGEPGPGSCCSGARGRPFPPQILAPSSTWSTATPRRVSPRSRGPRLSHRQEGPPSPGPPLAGGTVPSCSRDPFPEPTGPKAEVGGCPPGPGAVGTAQHPPGDTPATGRPQIVGRSRSGQNHVQQTQRFGSAGARAAETSPFRPKWCRDEAGASRTAPGRGALGLGPRAPGI